MMTKMIDIAIAEVGEKASDNPKRFVLWVGEQGISEKEALRLRRDIQLFLIKKGYVVNYTSSETDKP